MKSKQRCGFLARPWFVWLGMVVLLGGVAVAVGAMSQQTNKDTANTQTAWYSDAATPAAGMGSHAIPGVKNTEPASNYAKAMSAAFHEAAEKVLPSVVMITNTPQVVEHRSDRNSAPDENSEEMPFGFKGTPFGDLFNNPEFHHFFKQFHSGPMPGIPGHGTVGAGSGVIVDPSGVILTNNHVVAGGGKIMVRLQDGREFKAIDVKTDPKTDLAILRIKGAGVLPAARLGDSSKVEVGDWVLALGEPFGLEGTVTAGIVSAKGRGLGITDREEFIQTDAAINPGNSGGPLVNLDGEVVGINTVISTSNGGYQGVGFAIPANLAKWVGGQLETAGAVHRSYLGVVIQPVTQSLAEQFKTKAHQGVLVTDVRRDTPAAKAGLKPGDIILQFAGQRVSSPRELQSIVERQKVGSTEAMALLRNGKEISLNVTCREMPSDFAMASRGSHESGNESSNFEKLGIQVENLTPEIAEQLGVKAEHGVAITNVRSGSPAALAGLTTGMVITQANQRPVNSVEEFGKAIGNKPLEKGLLMLVQSAEGSRFVVVQMESK